MLGKTGLRVLVGFRDPVAVCFAYPHRAASSRFARATAPNHSPLGLTVRCCVCLSTAMIPNCGP